jgi:hypothetical protein
MLWRSLLPGLLDLADLKCDEDLGLNREPESGDALRQVRAGARATESGPRGQLTLSRRVQPRLLDLALLNLTFSLKA